MNNIIEHYRDEHAATKDRLPGAGLDWLNTSRAAALAAFREKGFPARGMEDWKYTNVRPIEKRPFRLARQAAGDAAIDTRLCADMASYRIVFVDGRYARHLSEPPGNLSPLATVKDLHTALLEDADALEAHLGKIADVSKNGFSALNMALMNDGACISIADNAVPERPIHLMFLSSGKQEEITSQIRILVMAGAGSRATIIESYHSTAGDVYFNNITTEIRVAAGAGIEHYKLQHESNKAFHIATLHVEQARGSAFTSFSVSMGAQLARNDINIWLGDEGANCDLYGLYMADGRQHTDFHTRIDHASPHCNSREIYKGILDGHARAVFNGQVHIHPDAQKSAAEQANHNLLLSRDAEVDTKPQLEIHADDVTASHGATIGQLDDNMIFYLRSRGLDYHTAHALLIYGFAHDIVEKMTIEPLRHHLQATLAERIPGLHRPHELVFG